MNKKMPLAIHESTRNYVYPETRNSLIFKVITEASSDITCELVCWNFFKEKAEEAVPKKMTGYARDERFSYHEVSVLSSESSRYIRYYFNIRFGATIVYLNRHGLSTEKPGSGFFEYHCTNELDIFQVPAWAKRAVCYQIFPERFYNGDSDLSPDRTAAWDDNPTRDNFFGGDLRGIIKKIDYLSALGINTIYLNPIFTSDSNHKYDTRDYYTIDPHFGTLDDLKELVQTCHGRNIRVILDGVFNHCGYSFHGFQDLLEKGENSRYREWFYPHSFPVSSEQANYDCVGYYKWMPKLRFAGQEAREYFLNVGAFWLREADIDGWRLDVADEVDYPFWQEFRRRIKEIKKDALLIGETWTDGSNLLEGDQMDSVMNYPFRDAVVDFIAKEVIDAREFNHRLMALQGKYKRMVYPVLYNLLGSHDTPRLFTECEDNKKKLKLAVVLQMTFPGMPAVYYGDETGMKGGNDPDCRGAMNWKNQDKDIFSHFQKLITLRLTTTCLYSGIFRPLYCQGRVYAFLRESDEERVYVAVNGAALPVTFMLPLLADDSGSYISLWSGREFRPSGKPSECENPDLTYCPDSMEFQLSDFGFEIIICKRSVNYEEEKPYSSRDLDGDGNTGMSSRRRIRR